MSLPYDVARCSGVQLDGEWREGCEDCLRRTSPGKYVLIAIPANRYEQEKVNGQRPASK